MRRHAFDPISLFFGAVFAGVGLVFLFGDVDLAALPPAWSWPIPLMIVGALIILLAVRRDRAYAPSRPAQRIPATDPIDPVGAAAFVTGEPVGAAGTIDTAAAGATAATPPEEGTVNLPDDS